MIELFVLDENRNKIYIIDNYTSLIWAKRYDTLGDCELMLSATPKNLKMFQDGVYIARDDDDMVCRIEKIQLNTDVENGNQLIITGTDVKKIVGQRIIWKQTNFNGLVEDYVRKLVNDNLINPSSNARKIDGFVLGEKANFTERINEQVTYDNLNTKIQETIKKYNWGYKVPLNDDKQFVFKLYKGEDKTDRVIFSENYENLSSTEYVEDFTDIANVALTAGEGEGSDRITTVAGRGRGIDRYEIYVDAKDISKTINYDDLKAAYPDGEEVTTGGVTYYQVYGVNIAIITKDGENVEAKLTDDIYDSSLESKGYENLATHTIKKSFNGSVEPRLTFTYKKDYDLGDIVTVANEYGISVGARILEVIEVFDENGYSVEPKFEYNDLTNQIVDDFATLVTEDNKALVTENEEEIITEGGIYNG